MVFLKELIIRLKKIKKRTLIVVGCLFIIGIALDFTTNSSFSANFADYILRPVIGNKNTVFLESILFNTQDSINQVVYKYISPPKNQFNNVGEQKQPISVSPGLNLTPILLKDSTLPIYSGEGQWQLMNSSMAKTFIRPDNKRAYAVVSLVQVDMHKLRLSAVAGIWEPGGGAGHKGPGFIPKEIQDGDQLVAAFNGGFQEKDGHYGMIVGNQVYLRLKNSLATLTIDKNSNLKIFNYQGQNLGTDNLVIRQNGQMLVQDSKIIPSDVDNQYNVWGRTVTNSMYTWRSGIGVTKEGNLIYAVGSSLVPQTLARALLAAGAVNAMQLDINPYWVRFVLFNPIGGGKYKHYSLLENMYDGGEQFLHGYQKDFFYLYKR